MSNILVLYAEAKVGSRKRVFKYIQSIICVEFYV